MLCVVINGNTVQACKNMLERVPQEVNLIELRIDYLDDPTVDQVHLIQKSCSFPMIFTLRGRAQGGKFQGTELERLTLIEALAHLSPAYIDLEVGTPQACLRTLREKFPHIKLIYSHHDFKKTGDLPSILQEMKKVPAEIYKMATMAHSFADVANTISLQSEKVALMHMGEWGHFLRILGPVWGNALTYACLNKAHQSAPGQVNVEELLGIYRRQNLSAATKIYALIGDPVEKSVGQIAHNAWMEVAKADRVYLKIKVSPYDLQHFFSHLRNLPIFGLSVTMPLKELVIPYLDEIDPQAQKIGAVNTILIQDGRLHGFNTDGTGSLEAIESQTPVKGKQIVVLGAGGASRALVFEATRRGARVTVISRKDSQAKKMVEEFGCQADHWDNLSRHPYEILVNATPLLNPVPTIIPGTHVMDMTTLPKLTPFLQLALNNQCKVTYGCEMFIQQAVEQALIWQNQFNDKKKIQETIQVTLERLLQ